MEIEANLTLNLSPSDLELLRGFLKADQPLVALRSQGRYSLSLPGLPLHGETIDSAIRAFLTEASSLQPEIQRVGGGVLRIGAFFDEAEAAAFSMELSQATIGELAHFRLSIEVTCYPCAREQ